MKYIAIRKESNNKLYIDKNFFNRFTDADLPMYNYTKIQIPDEYFDRLLALDFNNDLTFNKDKYIERIQKEEDLQKIPALKKRLEELTEDIVQHQAGAIIKNYDIKLSEFRDIHNEIRRIEGKPARPYN